MTLWATAGSPTGGYGASRGSGTRRSGGSCPGTTSEWLTFCAEHGIPAAPAAGLEEIIEALPDAEHPAGTYKHIPPPARFSASPATLRHPAPLPGQHNREVLAEAGLTDAEIDRLEADVLR